ncbi:hypothetical protein [Methylobacterium sp. Leaf106]|uniref:hypothetical protein n=1 Tax=Methylobacterium sp. Leaf106 TaxID=1736255 RepID=UPI0012E7F212|nr:hypothetical protein [Methylobacterium sp. Leaf106]
MKTQALRSLFSCERPFTMSFQNMRRAFFAPLPAAPTVGPVTRAIRGLRPNEMPSWEIREAEMRRQEAADLLALRRRVAKAVAEGIDFLDATGGDPDLEDDGDVEPDEDANSDDQGGEDALGWCENARQLGLGPNTPDGDATALERAGAGFKRSGHEDDEESHDQEADDDRELDMAEWGIGDADGLAEQTGLTA